MIKSFHHKLMKTYFALHKDVMKECKSLGLSSGQPKILEYLLENDGVCQKEIAMHCEIEKATVGTILDGMEQSGLIKRARKEGDRRSLFVFLTDLGREKANSVSKIFEKVEKKAFKSLCKDDQITFLKMVDEIYKNLTSED